MSGDNVTFLRSWAAAIRKSSGNSIDAIQLDEIANDFERLRADHAAKIKDYMDICEKLSSDLAVEKNLVHYYRTLAQIYASSPEEFKDREAVQRVAPDASPFESERSAK